MTQLILLVAAVLFVAMVSIATAQVKQVDLCKYEDCPKVSRIGLGALHIGDVVGGIFDPVKINLWLRTGLKQGITLLDTADVYPVRGGKPGTSAELIGKAFQLTPNLREKFVINAKIDIASSSSIDTSRSYLESKVEWFLGALQTDYLDILMLHYPNSFMNATEVAELFVDLKASGKVRYFGVSNHFVSHMELLQKKLDKVSNNSIKLVTNEYEVSVWNPSALNYNSNLIDHAYTKGYRTFAWSSMAGNPTGGLNRLFQLKGTRQHKIMKTVKAVQSQLGESSPERVALAWVLAHPSGIIPLIGTTNTTRVVLYTTDIMEASKRINTTQWWSIGKAGGLCPLAATECDYSEYRY